jgi:hypothetical protein
MNFQGYPISINKTLLLLNPRPPDQSQNDGDDSNYQQNVNDVAHAEAPETEKSNEPNDNQNDGNRIQDISHRCVWLE